MKPRLRLRRPAMLCLALLPVLASCGGLPASGPTTAEVVDRFKPNPDKPNNNPLGVRLVDLTPGVLQALNTAPRSSLSEIDALRSNRPVDRIGPGDVISVTIFETGAGLFSSQRAPLSGTDPGAATAGTSTASSETLPRLQVDRSGRVMVPYAGEIDVAGRTATEVQRLIESRLAGKAAQPQVLVSVLSNDSNVVFVSGDVKSSGRFPLSLQRENLLDMIALAGGPTHSPQDTLVRVTRRGRDAQTSLTQVQGTASENIPIEPQDRIQVDYRPRTYLVFGATGRVAQQPFDQASVSLAEAVARTGGLDDQRANPESLFLFRFEQPGVVRAYGQQAARDPVPVIYRVDMRDPQNYFLIQQFAMHDKDLIYVANARTVQLYKFLQLINSVFTPFVYSRAVAN